MPSSHFYSIDKHILDMWGYTEELVSDDYREYLDLLALKLNNKQTWLSILLSTDIRT